VAWLSEGEIEVDSLVGREVSQPMTEKAQQVSTMVRPDGGSQEAVNEVGGLTETP